MEVYYWILLGIAFIIAEIFTATFFLASLSIAAFISGFSAYLGYDFKIQLFVFSIVAMILFFVIRPLCNRFFLKSGNRVKTGVEALIGNSYKVTEEINNVENLGRVQVGGESWRARSNTSEIFKINDMVKVVRVEGSTLLVSSK